MFGKLIDILKKSPKKIVFTEGTDPRILEASARLLSGTFLTPILVGKESEIRAAAEDAGFNIRGAEIYDPETYEKMDAMVEKMVELRKGKMTADECRAMLHKGNYFGTMLVAMGIADALLGGATYSTAVRPALQLVKTKPGNSIVSSCFILVRPYATGGNMVLAMADCAINIKPTEDELVEIATETAKDLVEVVEGAQEIVVTINRIASASKQQAEAVAQVTQGVDQISSVIQTNSATSEESAAASEELSSQAALMKELLARFKLRQDGFSAKPQPAYAAAAPAYEESYDAAPSRDTSASSVFSKY